MLISRPYKNGWVTRQLTKENRSRLEKEIKLALTVKAPNVKWVKVTEDVVNIELNEGVFEYDEDEIKEVVRVANIMTGLALLMQ